MMEDKTTSECDTILAEIESAQKRMRETYDRALRVESIYRGDGDPENSDSDRFKILWSITEMQRPLVYDERPDPVVRRRFLEKDEPARMGAQLIERGISYFQECEGHEFQGQMNKVRDDFLVVGRGTARIMYEASFETKATKKYLTDEELMETPESVEVERDEVGTYRWSEDPEDGAEEEKTYEKVYAKYVHWSDFLHSDGRQWDDVWWEAFGSWLTREDLIDQFGKEVGEAVPLMKQNLERDGYKARHTKSEISSYADYARVWEVWNKRTRMVYKVAECYNEFLEEPIEDPLGLEEFFPSPEPAYILDQNSSLEFVPEYKMYEDQARELNILTARIDRLTSSLAVRGVYDSSHSDSITRLLSGFETQLIPCENFRQLVSQGGAQGAIEWLPIANIVDVLSKLLVQRDQNLKIIYEVVGLSDIIRGQTQPREAGKTQQMKMMATTGRRSRIGVKQKKLERFSRDMIRLMGEVMAELFSAETMLAVTGISPDKFPNAMEGVQEVLRLLRSDAVRGFRIDIETDSTVAPDEMREQDEMMTFFGGIAQLVGALQGAVSGGMMGPEAAKDLTMWAVRRFPAGRDLEDILEKASEAPPQQQPDPEQQAKMMEMQIKQAKLQLEAKELEADLMIRAQELQLKAAELQQDREIEAAKIMQKQAESLINLRTAMVNARGGNVRK
jgi:hypothetical protein